MKPFLNINLRVTIADNIKFNVVESIRIENSTEKFTDTAKIVLPREFKQAVKNGDRFSIADKKLLDVIKIGDSIRIEAGYNGEYHTEFVGYITKIGAEAPIEIECEDEMYKLKKAQPIKKLYSAVDLKVLLRDIAPGYEIETFKEMPLGKFAVNNATPYKVIEYLKQNYGVRCFFKGKKLIAGLNISLKPDKVHEFNLNRNVKAGSSLVYETKENRKRWIKAISKQKGNSKEVTYEFGEQGESEITLHGPINLNQAQLKKWAEDYYKSLVYDGYSGDFNSWGIPRTKAGDSAKITDPNYPDKHRDGLFYISSVVIDISESEGFQRKNTITFKIKDKDYADI